MSEVNDGVAVVRGDRIVEDQLANLAPIPERPADTERRAVGLPFVGDVDGERQRSFRHRIAAVEDLGHDLVAVVEMVAGDHRMSRSHQQLHERRRPRRLAGRLSEFGDRIHLANRGLLIHAAKEASAALELWCFQANTGGRRFYERHGFRAIRFTDGADNEEKVPDVRYRWER